MNREDSKKSLLIINLMLTIRLRTPNRPWFICILIFSLAPGDRNIFTDNKKCINRYHKNVERFENNLIPTSHSRARKKHLKVQVRSIETEELLQKLELLI